MKKLLKSTFLIIGIAAILFGCKQSADSDGGSLSQKKGTPEEISLSSVSLSDYTGPSTNLKNIGLENVESTKNYLDENDDFLENGFNNSDSVSNNVMQIINSSLNNNLRSNNLNSGITMDELYELIADNIQYTENGFCIDLEPGKIIFTDEEKQDLPEDYQLEIPLLYMTMEQKIDGNNLNIGSSNTIQNMSINESFKNDNSVLYKIVSNVVTNSNTNTKTDMKMDIENPSDLKMIINTKVKTEVNQNCVALLVNTTDNSIGKMKLTYKADYDNSVDMEMDFAQILGGLSKPEITNSSYKINRIELKIDVYSMDDDFLFNYFNSNKKTEIFEKFPSLNPEQKM